jgi:hypothetical protein
MTPSRELLIKRGLGDPLEKVSIYIGVPEVNFETGGASCSVAVDGFINHSCNVYGIDQFDALKRAIKFVETLFFDLPPSHQLFWPDGEPFDM